MITKILLTLSYNGTNYCGWQVQPNGITVQQVLCGAVEALFGARYDVTGCSRTDSGVHANMFCASVELDSSAPHIPTEKIPNALNQFLPRDISVYEAREVECSFHARYSVCGKEYLYMIYNAPYRNPFFEDRAYYYPRPLDIAAMNSAAQYFVGTHDFRSFMSAASGTEDTVRTIDYFTAEKNGAEIKIRVFADGFLYNMVRILVGTLISVSENKIQAENIPAIIESKDRKNAGPTAPPCGLYLNRVEYK